MTESKNPARSPDEEDRQAMRREQWADIQYFAGVAVMFAICLGAALLLIRGGLDPVLRVALSVIPPALAMLCGGLWSLRVHTFDERQKKIAYRATSFGALALGGMYTGAAAAWGIHETAARGLIVLAFCALPLLLLWSAFFNAFLLRNWK
jgi:hypothetical protein